MLNQTALRYFYTIRHLKGRQLFYQTLYRARRVIGTGSDGAFLPLSSVSQAMKLFFAELLPKPESYRDGEFTFLNLSKSFGAGPGSIDWTYSGYGKLWTYNLAYFDFLLQPGMDVGTGHDLIRSYIAAAKVGDVSLEPYPISLRGMNWIKFLSLHGVEDRNVNASLHAQYGRLYRNIEYHLLGNHLLENAFSLLFGACYFQERRWFLKARRILFAELTEQILSDGAHFELSPMYHQILLDRLCDSVNLLMHNSAFDGQADLLSLLLSRSAMMISWMKGICFTDGSIPHLNDATDGIAPDSASLFAYAERLGMLLGKQPILPFRASGYRKYFGACYECIVDVGQVGPEYIPGHAHADTLNFVMRVKGSPFLVDTGTSSYEPGSIRNEERGTGAHNTVLLNGSNSSDVWGGFRLGRRARVKVVEESEASIVAEHDGYGSSGVLHRRAWAFDAYRAVIRDSLIGSEANAEARLHFDHALTPELEGRILRMPGVCIAFSGGGQVGLQRYRQALGFNKSVDAWCAVVSFRRVLETVMEFG